MRTPTFFGAIAPVIGAVGGLLGGHPKQTFFDDSAVRQQMQDKSLAQAQQRQAAEQQQRAGEQVVSTSQQASRQRVEALDRIIGAFQQNLRIK